MNLQEFEQIIDQIGQGVRIAAYVVLAIVIAFILILIIKFIAWIIRGIREAKTRKEIRQLKKQQRIQENK